MIKVGITKMLKSTTMRMLKKFAKVKNESQDYRIGGGAVASDGLADWRCLSRWGWKLVIVLIILLIVNIIVNVFVNTSVNIIVNIITNIIVLIILCMAFM